MANQPQYHMDTGTPDQLPKGAAQDLNEAAAQASAGSGNATPSPNGQGATSSLAPQTQPGGTPLGPVSSRKPDTSQITPPGEDDSLLFGPTGRPDEHIGTGAGLAGKSTTPPGADKWLPALVEASQDPTAPQMFRDMLKLVQHHMGT